MLAVKVNENGFFKKDTRKHFKGQWFHWKFIGKFSTLKDRRFLKP